MEQAEKNRSMGIRTILFVDEIHRFNKAQHTADYAEKLIVENGGKVTEDSYSIVLQEPVALPMEDALSLIHI